MIINVVFEEILALTEEKHIIISKRVIMQIKKLVISYIQMQVISHMPVLFGKWNSHAKFIHRSCDNE